MERDIYKSHNCQIIVSDLIGDLRSHIDALFPLVVPTPTRHLFLPTAGAWSLYCDNYLIGTDAAGPMKVLSKYLNADAMRIVASDQLYEKQTRRVKQYGATILEYYSSGETRRTIACVNDGGRWIFEASGNPFEFENVAIYDARPAKDRFNKEILLEYLAGLGVGRVNDSFCVPRVNEAAYLIERKCDDLPSLKEVSKNELLAASF